MQTESETIMCKCGHEVLIETAYDRKGNYDRTKHGCKCKNDDKGKVDAFFDSRLAQAIADNDLDVVAEETDRTAAARLPVEARVEMMKHSVSSVNKDMIKCFYLPDARVEIPESYFWKIKVENPRLCVSDFIEHIWKLQKEGIDPSSGDAKIITFSASRRIDGRWSKVESGVTMFSYKYMIAKAKKDPIYDGHTIDTGVGDYFNVITEEIESQPYASCTVHMKGRRPLTYTAWLPEFIKKNDRDQPTKAWKKPMVMLTKTAINNAYRQAFPDKLDFLVDTNNDFNEMEER